MINANKQNPMVFFRDKCRQHSLNITPQRTAIYQELINAKNHPDSEDIFRKIKNVFPQISLDTVYRTLSKFAEIGLVYLVEGYGESKRYDPDTNNHHHFRCSICNKIVDFHDYSFDNLKVPKAFQTNFRVTNIKIILEGTCDECIKKT